MLTTLNNEQLFLKEIKRSLPQNDKDKNNERSIGKLIFGLVKILLKIPMVNIELSNALKSVSSQIKNDYYLFLKSEPSDKEEILIKWEKLARVLNNHMVSKPNRNILTIGVINKTTKITTMVNKFAVKLEAELYSDDKTNFSQEYLQKLSIKFQHLPKDVYDDLTSNQHLECA